MREKKNLPRRGIEPGTIRLQFQHVIGHRGGWKVVENYVTYHVHYIRYILYTCTSTHLPLRHVTRHMYTVEFQAITTNKHTTAGELETSSNNFVLLLFYFLIRELRIS